MIDADRNYNRELEKLKSRKEELNRSIEQDFDESMIRQLNILTHKIIILEKRIKGTFKTTKITEDYKIITRTGAIH